MDAGTRTEVFRYPYNSDNVYFNGGISCKEISEGYNDLGTVSGNRTISLASGTFVKAIMSNFTTFTINPGLNTGAIGFSLLLSSSAGSIGVAFNGNIKWPNGNTAPTRTATSGRADLWTFFSYDGGSTWWGNIAIYNFVA